MDFKNGARYTVVVGNAWSEEMYHQKQDVVCPSRKVTKAQLHQQQAGNNAYTLLTIDSFLYFPFSHAIGSIPTEQAECQLVPRCILDGLQLIPDFVCANSIHSINKLLDSSLLRAEYRVERLCNSAYDAIYKIEHVMSEEIVFLLYTGS